MKNFSTMPDLVGATPPPQVEPIDLEYSPFSAPLGLPKQSADTLEQQNSMYRQAIEPFARAGAVYRQGCSDPDFVALIVELDGASAVLTVGDFMAAADAIQK